MKWLISGAVALIAYWNFTAPRFKFGEIIRVPQPPGHLENGRYRATPEQARAYARRLALADDEYEVIDGGYNMGAPTALIRITRGRA